MIASSLIGGILALKRYNKDLIRTITLYGHIYKEFKNQYSPFDIVKMLFKLLIICVLNVDPDSVSFSSEMAAMILILYLGLIILYSPFYYYMAHN
jgi:hypothetical protein